MPAGKFLGAALAALAIGLVPASPAMAQASGLHAGTLEVPLNKSQVVSADRVIAKAMVGNADVADVLPVTSKSVYVLGKAIGTTSLTLYDANGRVLSVVDISVGPDVQAFRDQAASLLPNEHINASISGSSMVLSGIVSTPGMADRAVQLAKTFAGDKVVNLMSMGSAQQVMLEVKFAEVSRSVGKDLGSSFVTQGAKFSSVTGAGTGFVPGTTDSQVVSTNSAGLTSTTTSGTLPQNVLSPIANQVGIFRTNFNIGGLSITSVINAMESKGLAKTLAEPTLVALSGEKASFLAGGEFPIPIVQSGNSPGTQATGISIQFKSFGVSLGFTPTVLGDKTISLIVEPEVSSIDPTASVSLNGFNVPGLQTRRASTTLQLRDGESFAIAGLLQRDFKTTIRQLPLLGSIPIIGTLFRSSQFQKGQTELLIVVTPHLVAPLRPDQVHLPTDNYKDPNMTDIVVSGKDTEGTAPSGKADKPKKQGDGYEF